MAPVLFTGSDGSLIVLPLMIFHQLQPIVCAVLARHHSGRADELPAIREPEGRQGAGEDRWLNAMG